jgi:WD40 repeat protein
MTFGEGEVVRDLEFSPDGTALVSVAGNDSDFAIRLWEVGSGQPLRTLQGHTSIVWGVAFSPDGKLLASASKDGTAKVWDWRSGELVESLNFPNEVTSVAFSPDSQTLAVGGVDASPNAAVWTYSVASWQLLMKLAEFWNIPAMAYSPDGSVLVGGGTSRNVRVWSISPDGSTVATGLCQASENSQCTRGAVWLWNLQTGTLIKKLADFSDWVQGVGFSADGSVLIAGSRDGTLRAYTTADYQPVFATTWPDGVQALSVSPDSRLLATGNSRGEVDLWRVEH